MGVGESGGGSTTCCREGRDCGKVWTRTKRGEGKTIRGQELLWGLVVLWEENVANQRLQ